MSVNFSFRQLFLHPEGNNKRILFYKDFDVLESIRNDSLFSIFKYELVFLNVVKTS